MRRLPPIRDLPWLLLGVGLWVFVDWPWGLIAKAWARFRAVSSPSEMSS